MKDQTTPTSDPDRGRLMGRRLVCVALHLVAYLYLTFKPLLFTAITYDVGLSVPFSQTALLTLLAMQVRWRTELRFLLGIAGLALSWYSLSKFGMWSLQGATAAEMAITLLSLAITTSVGHTAVRVYQTKRNRAFDSPKGNLAVGVPDTSGASVGLKSLVLWTTLFAFLFAMARYGGGILGWSTDNLSQEVLMAHVLLGIRFGVMAIALLAWTESWRFGKAFRVTVTVTLVIAGLIALSNWAIQHFVPNPAPWHWKSNVTEGSFCLIVSATLFFWQKGASSSNEACRI